MLNDASADRTSSNSGHITSLYEGESNETLIYVLSRNLLNTKVTQLLHFSMQYRTATCRPLFKP